MGSDEDYYNNKNVHFFSLSAMFLTCSYFFSSSPCFGAHSSAVLLPFYSAAPLPDCASTLLDFSASTLCEPFVLVDFGTFFIPDHVLDYPPAPPTHTSASAVSFSGLKPRTSLQISTIRSHLSRNWFFTSEFLPTMSDISWTPPPDTHTHTHACTACPPHPDI